MAATNTGPTPPTLHVEVEDLRRLAAAINDQQPWISASEPTAPDGTDVATAALNQLNASYTNIKNALKAGRLQGNHLADSLKAAADAYDKTDDEAHDALAEAGKLDGVPVQMGNPGVPQLPSPPTIPQVNMPYPPGPQWNMLISWKTVAHQLASPHATESLDTLHDRANQLSNDLIDYANSINPNYHWAGKAADACTEKLRNYQNWLRRMADSCKVLAAQADQFASSHKIAYDEHPKASEADNAPPSWLDFTGAAAAFDAAQQARSEAVMHGYASGANLKEVKTDNPPDSAAFGAPPAPAAPQPGGPGTPGGPSSAGGSSSAGGPSSPGSPPMPSVPQMPSTPQMPGTPRQPAAHPPGGMPGGLPSGGTPGGAPSGGMPGGMPGGRPAAAKHAAPTPPTGPGVKPVSVGGGGAGGGGGAAKAPLEPSVASRSVAPSAADKATESVAGGTGPSPGGAMGGGMGGMPMGARGGQQGKEKRRSPGLAPDESLYQEDRAWTEGVIGNRKRKNTADTKESK